ncbi:VanZ family protein [Lachnospiraceae bacterium]|jgi:VanZ family protein|nr:VanZ family protein [uncultured Schaedlerella sp.]MCI9153359.1 VanZ family protein [Ruminococcus sp.]NBI58629.1 VanZ family protein [Lachnospiraceae bacterium]
MKHIILFFLKPLSFLPALAMMCVIYGFSAQDGSASGNMSYQVSYKIVEIGNEILDKGLDETQIADCADQIGYPVRKLAHMTEYFLLAVAVSFPFYVYGLRGFPLMLVAGFICVAFAAGDEYHQSFVAGRGPSVKDVGIDSIGAFFGILTVQIICWVFLAPARSARRQKEFAYRKRARREEAQRRREYIRRQEAAQRRRSRY